MYFFFFLMMTHLITIKSTFIAVYNEIYIKISSLMQMADELCLE